MKKLNNKGMTTIEVLLCFVLTVLLAASMFGTISAFNQKRLVEEYKEKIYTYKELLTKDIQDDFIKVGLTHAKYERTIMPSADGEIPAKTVVHTVDCDMKDGTTRQLKIYQAFTKAESRISNNEAEKDYFMIEYGPTGYLTQYPIPDLGESPAYPDTNDPDKKDKKIKDLTINNILIKIEDDRALSIYIGLYHPELSTRYAIDIKTPIDYMSASSISLNYLFADSEPDPTPSPGIIPLRDLYVSSSGNDSTGTGTIDNPYATLQTAYNNAPSDATIYIMDNITQTTAFTLAQNKNIVLTSCTKSGSTCPTSGAHSVIRASSNTNDSLFNISSGIVHLNMIIIDGNNVAASKSLITNNSELSIDANATIQKGNNSSNGGGITNNSKLIINGGVITNNHASYGGGIINGSELIINSGTISNNISDNSGGGIYENGTITINDGTISNNQAGTYGGGLICKKNCTMKKGVITGNKTTTYDGGAVRNDGTFTMIDGTITNNQSARHGGGISSSSASATIINGGTISTNTAAVAGGGLHLYGTNSIENAIISNNTATQSGGGIYLYASASLTIKDGTSITSNTSYAKGENSYWGGGGVACNGNLTLSGGTIASNKAPNGKGGGIRVGAGGNITMTGGIIKKNNAGTDGGLHVHSGGTYSKTGGYICNNNTPTNSYNHTSASPTCN